MLLAAVILTLALVEAVLAIPVPQANKIGSMCEPSRRVNEEICELIPSSSWHLRPRDRRRRQHGL